MDVHGITLQRQKNLDGPILCLCGSVPGSRPEKQKFGFERVPRGQEVGGGRNHEYEGGPNYRMNIRTYQGSRHGGLCAGLFAELCFLTASDYGRFPRSGCFEPPWGGWST